MTRIKTLLAVSLVTLGLWSIGVVAYASNGVQNLARYIDALEIVPTQAEFPVIDEAQLSPTQRQIVAIVGREYEVQPPGTKYSVGIREPWCADFVSWVMREAGQPLSNPNSGSWRIPGTYTLRAYYEAAGTFRSADSGYVPKLGDVMLYDYPSPFGQHTNIVLKNEAVEDPKCD